ncbi:MAG: hypothetical protein AB8H80_17960 [Planctomycetota bacterium]
MSLFGTGRREGVIAVMAVLFLVLAARLAVGATAEWFGAVESEPLAWLTATSSALGGCLIYRMLRAQGRTRYAAFLGGAAYGLSPLFLGLAGCPREQLAAATAPLALEAAYQCARPSRRRFYLPWLGLYAAIPFLFGVGVVAVLAASLTGLVVLGVALHERNAETRIPLAALLLSVATATAAAVTFVEVDAFGTLLGPRRVQPIDQVLGGEVSLLSVTRLFGPVLAWFAVFGLLRRQRQVATKKWLSIAIVGMAPTVLVRYPEVGQMMRAAPWSAFIPGAAWWLSMLAITVLGAAGLDDWLEQPMRRRRAHAALLIGTVVAGPILAFSPQAAVDHGPGSAFGSNPEMDPLHLTAVLVTLAVLAALSITWRRLGVLRFKNVLALAALLACTVPVVASDWLHTLEEIVPTGAAPLAEIPTRASHAVIPTRIPSSFAAAAAVGQPSSSIASIGQALRTAPWLHLCGALGALLISAAWSLRTLRSREPAARASGGSR